MLTEASRRAVWRAIGNAIAAHVVMLRDTAVFDDPVAAAVLTALDGVRCADPPEGDVSDLVAVFDARLEALTAPAAAGASGVGRQRAEIAATAVRLTLRDELLALQAALDEMRLALLDFAGQHVFTLMPAYAEGRPAQPTTLAHYLGGAIGPLSRATDRLRLGYAEVNRSPMGAGALASTGVRIDREATARALGFDGPIASTFDAVAATDHLAAALDPATTAADTLARFLEALRGWLRHDPDSLRLAEAWQGDFDAALPQFRPAVGLNQLAAEAAAIVADAAVAKRLAAAIPYGPAGAALDVPFARTMQALGATRALAERAARLVAGGIEVNRAYFANRAGRDHTTASDLADMLMVEEGLDPASARAIAGMVVRQSLEAGIEASGITPQAIDAAALLIVGRELGMEIERFGSYLAPRKFLERRVASGGPAPGAVRETLEMERARVLADERWREEAAGRIRSALAGMERETAEILAVE
ncbi:MAG: hypothetical protein IT337_07440 [Thermomicrobiales bacterium]|nr:hypothetical protein [Thermomicrobiales bacterium]